MVETRPEPSRWNEVFWLGVALIVLGVFAPESLVVADTRLSRVLFWGGTALLFTRVLVALYRYTVGHT